MTRILKRNLLTCTITENGCTLHPPTHRGLVLSGGGSKGIGYAGMIRAMNECGFIQELTHVSGASAGAMIASLIAVGLSSEHITNIVCQLNPVKFLDNSGLNLRAKGHYVRNMFNMIYFYQIKQHLLEINPPSPSSEMVSAYELLKLKLMNCDEALKEHGIVIQNFDDVIHLGKSKEGLEKLGLAFAMLTKRIIKDLDGLEIDEMSIITFGDLVRLRDLLPEDKKHRIKHLSVVVTNQTKKELETFNERINAKESIAEKVQLSGAHPILFAPARNARGERFADGGILDNMPTQILEKEGLDREVIVCVKIEDNASYNASLKRVKSPNLQSLSLFSNGVDRLAQVMVGGPVLRASTEVTNREKIFYQLNNMLYINSGKLKTTTKSPSFDLKKEAIDIAYTQTKIFLADQTKTYDNPLVAILHLGVEQLNRTIISESTNTQLLLSAGLAKAIYLIQAELVSELKDNIFQGIEYYTKQINSLLENSELNKEQQTKAMALCMQQVNYLTEGKFKKHLDRIEKQAAKENIGIVSWFKWLLQLLCRSVQWIFSKLTSPSADTDVNCTLTSGLNCA